MFDIEGRMEKGEMRMLGGEWRVVRFWHSELERVDARQLWMVKGGRTAVRPYNFTNYYLLMI